VAGEAERVRRIFTGAYGHHEGVRVFRGPGRVNLIGEHTDYNLGFVLPMALDLACFVAAAPNENGTLRVLSENEQDTQEWDLRDLAGAKHAGHWSDYVVGVAIELIRAGYSIGPADLAIWSTVPVGSGLSSSAALEVAIALALLAGRPMDPLQLALLCRRAENQFVGTPCGIMDQYVSVFGRENSAIEIDCRSLQHKTVSLPAGVEIIAVNSMVKHELGQSAYRRRVQECSEAVEAIRRIRPEVKSLRDATLANVEAVMKLASPNVFRRARHVVSEDARVQRFASASAAGDFRAMGSLFVESHRSLQYDYEVSCEELDFLVDTAVDVPGVWGARMTGGGFGGCTVNLVAPGAAAQFEQTVCERYRAKFGVTPKIYPCCPSAGASEI
jgi:galactokinase